MLNFIDAMASIRFSVNGVLFRFACSKIKDSSLSLDMVDLTADRVPFIFENSFSGFQV